MSQSLVCLASGSPRRAELLRQIGVAFVVRAADIDETPVASERPHDYVARLARAKAESVARAGDMHSVPVLGADTAVIVNDLILGKPANETEAIEMLGLLSGRKHVVLTAVSIAHHGAHHECLSESTVTMRPISTKEMHAYWRCGEPRDKAGAYAIQGRGAMFIDTLSGSYSGVVGLPLAETAALLSASGVALWPKI